MISVVAFVQCEIDESSQAFASEHDRFVSENDDLKESSITFSG